MNTGRWYRIHRWMGRIIGAYALVFVASGVAIVFFDEIEAPVVSVRCNGSVDAVSSAIAHAHPDFQGPWTLILGQEANPHQAIFTPDANKDMALATSVWVDPCSGKIMAERRWGTTAMTILYDLHTSMLLGPPGRILIGVGGAALATMLITGMLMAFRRSQTYPDQPARRWHRYVGLAALPGMFVMLATGLWLAFYDWTYPYIDRISPMVASSRPVSSVPLPLSLDDAVALAQRHASGSPRMINFLGNGSRTVVVSLYTTSDANPNRPATRVWVDMGAARITAQRSSTDMGFMEKTESWLLPLHSGQVLGSAGRWLVVSIGMLMIACASLGFMMTILRRSGARRD